MSNLRSYNIMFSTEELNTNDEKCVLKCTLSTNVTAKFRVESADVI